MRPITIDDAVYVRGKHLFQKRNATAPFTVKGIAFPTPPERYDDEAHLYGYNATAWIALLKQLRLDLGLDFNAVRLYRMRPDLVDYAEFLEGAAALGVYVIAPLTSAAGAGVLDRTAAAPRCYGRKLFGYGAAALAQYLKHPNVLAGMVGNEVMNDEGAWRAAPCVRAYARDLRRFMDRNRGEWNRTLPLIYATQDSSVIGGAGMDKDRAMGLTAEYLTCAGEGEEDEVGESPINILGVNVESWCSSTQDYERNPDGTPGPYYSLHESLKNLSVPVIFSEMGCPHSQFDRDDPKRRTDGGARDWGQVPVVTGDMADAWSGFVAYTMDGPEDFNMMAGGPWDGAHALAPTSDFENFKGRLDESSGVTVAANDTDWDATVPRPCSEVEAELWLCCGLRLFDDQRMRSFEKDFDAQGRRKFEIWPACYVVVALAVFVSSVMLRKRRGVREEPSDDVAPLRSVLPGDAVKYGSV